MNVNPKFSSAQFPSYTSVGASTVIKHRRQVTGESDDSSTIKKAEAEQKVAAPPVEGTSETVISDEEKKYFENLFPGSANEIRAYSPYGRNGLKQPATLGSLIDLKG
ncbi:MAG TPA: hypothetical protein VMH23_18235 [Bacteroidota bacterium]|nr:hypothetical protein [Bacteroidota bacterium]